MHLHPPLQCIGSHLPYPPFPSNYSLPMKFSVPFLLISLPLLLLAATIYRNPFTTLPKLHLEPDPAGFDDPTCLSRHQRRPSPLRPSAHLVSALRAYERRHRSCGPNSEHFNRTLLDLAARKPGFEASDCRYIVWLPENGLGNQMVSLAATFLYALLTRRVLLVGLDSPAVFCEPFPDSTWILPSYFPHRNRIEDLPIMETIAVNATVGDFEFPAFAFVNVPHVTKEHDIFFHCDEEQEILKKIPVLFLRSDQYFVPSLFMVESFAAELRLMFPAKDTVFHHLGLYLFSPSNEVWRIVTRFYNENLAMAENTVGIQVRVFADKVMPEKIVMEQILSCTLNNSILPKPSKEKKLTSSTSVLVTSLYKNYSDNLRAMYSETGGAVKVWQPSHEAAQKFGDGGHDAKALAEMYLLSLCGAVVSSGQSTFGYVGSGLGGLRPWIMHKSTRKKVWDPPCERAASMEPCFHFPPRCTCKGRRRVDHVSSVYPSMRRCEDLKRGVKMVR